MILAVLQARMSSRRLPGKVLRPICGKPMLHLQIERVRRSKRVGKLLVATSEQSDDDAIASSCADLGVVCERGPLGDVLERFRRAVEKHQPDHVVRLTADCPLADWQVIDALIALHLDAGNDYSTNALQRSYPHGLDCEIMTASVLCNAAAHAQSPHEREHVTPYMYSEAGRFRVGHLVARTDRSFLRWTVDNSEDLTLVDAIYRELYAATPNFGTEQVISLLGRRPELRSINAMHQNPGERAAAEAFWRRYDADREVEMRA